MAGEGKNGRVRGKKSEGTLSQQPLTLGSLSNVLCQLYACWFPLPFDSMGILGLFLIIRTKAEFP